MHQRNIVSKYAFVAKTKRADIRLLFLFCSEVNEVWISGLYWTRTVGFMRKRRKKCSGGAFFSKFFPAKQGVS